MAGVHFVPDFTQSDDEVTDMASGPTSPVILEVPDPAMLMEISRYFEAAQGMLGNSSKVSTAAESDSGDLSVTAPVQVPQAHRYRRRPQLEATTASDESEGETLSSYQPARSSAAASRKRVKGPKKWSFQAYHAPFLEGSSFNATLASGKRGRVFTAHQEARLKGNEFFVKSTKRKCPRRQGRTPSSSRTKKLVRTKTVTKAKTTKRVRGRGSRPVYETRSRGKNRPSSPPLPTPPEEEEAAASVESTQPKDHLVIESAGDSAVLEEPSGLVLQRDSSSDVTRVQEVIRPPAMPCTDDNISAGSSQPNVVRESACRSPDVSERKTTRTNKSKKKICQMASESGEVAVESAPGVADEHENDNNNDDDEEHSKIKKRKKEKKRKVAEEEDVDISFDVPWPASETPCISQPSSESTVAINNHKEDDDDEEHTTIKKRKKEKKRVVAEEEEVDIPLDEPALETSDISQRTSASTLTFNNDDYSFDGSVGQLVNLDIVFTHEVSAPAETATVAFKKRKRKKEKMAPCPEDPETHPEAEHTEGVNPFKRPADPEVALEHATLETPDVSRKTLGSAATIVLNGDEEHRIRKKKKKAKKRDISFDGPCPASETPDISLALSESTVAINNHKEGDDEEEHRKIKKRKKEKKRKVTEEEKRDISFDGPCPASETPDISLALSESTVAINNHEEGDDEEEHRKIKKRKKEKKRKFAEEEDVPCPWPALETPDISQPASVPTLTFNNNNADHSFDGSVGQLEDLWKPRKKSKKNKTRMTDGAVAEVNVVDAETGTETTTVGFKKTKRKKDKTALRPEDPETNPEAEHTEIEENPPKHPAGREVECPRKKRRKQKMAETSQCASSEDTLVEGSGATSGHGKKRKHSHSFLSDDTVENHPEPKLFVASFENRRQKNKNKDKRVSASDFDREPVANGETPVESLTGPGKTVETKKKKKREREASSASVLEGNESCEGDVQGVRSSAETGDDGLQKKKKKKKKKDKKADRESESPMEVERETPDDIETAVLIKKKDKCKRNPRPPPQGSTPT
ncbi:unnamed protein product [Merluccius merluccius]